MYWWTSAWHRPTGSPSSAKSQRLRRRGGGFVAGQQSHPPGGRDAGKAAQFGAEVVQLGTMQIPDEIISIIPRPTAKKYRVIPLFKTDGKVAVAIADPSDLNTIDSLTHLAQRGD